MIRSLISFTTFGFSACILSGLLLGQSAVQAQVSVSPMIVEAQANRGQAQGSINISNNTDQPFRARLYTQPFTYNRDTGFQTLTASPSDLSPYLQFSPRELTVQPGQTRQVRLITRLAPSLADGEYRAVIFAENLKETNTQDINGKNIAITTRIGVTVYARKGDLIPQLKVRSASFNSSQNQIQLLVGNSGKASAVPNVSWTLKQGQTVIQTGSVAAAVIAESDRNLSLNYPGKEQPALAPGTYQLTGELAWGNDKDKKTLPFNVNLTIPAQGAVFSGR